MPEEGKLTFQNHHRQLSAPYIIYAVFEALTTKIKGPELDPLKSSTRKTQEDEACSYCYIVVRCDGQTEAPVVYRGPNAEALQKEERKIKAVLANRQAMHMTREDRRAYDSATTCHVCEKPLAGNSVRDHCHITGQYGGAAHNACNLKLWLNHLRGYDSRLIMQAISKVEGKDSCIPNNTEKYISFSLRQLCFIDSAQFLLASLDTLVTENRPEAFQITAQYEPNEARRKLIMRKGMTPMSTWTPGRALRRPSSHPRRPSTASYPTRIFTRTTPTLGRSGRPLGARPWGTTATCTAALTSCCSLTCSRPFGGPAKSSRAWTRLTTTPARVSSGTPCSKRHEWGSICSTTSTCSSRRGCVEGGISMIYKRHANANNPLVESYDPEKPSSHILYLAAYNLYGWAMSQYLPTGGFWWWMTANSLQNPL